MFRGRLKHASNTPIPTKPTFWTRKRWNGRFSSLKRGTPQKKMRSLKGRRHHVLGQLGTACNSLFAGTATSICISCLIVRETQSKTQRWEQPQLQTEPLRKVHFVRSISCSTRNASKRFKAAHELCEPFVVPQLNGSEQYNFQFHHHSQRQPTCT